MSAVTTYPSTKQIRISAVDLFCGAGGLTFGLQRSGINVRMGVDIDPACRFPYEHNTGSRFISTDVSDLSVEDVAKHLGGADFTLIAGCAPCQPFSTYSRGRTAYSSGRWGLLRAFGRLVRELSPDFVTMENVRSLGNHQVFQEFQSTLSDAGYSLWHDFVDCRGYGVPQSRVRLVLLASRHGPIELAAPTRPRSKWITVEEAIGSLSPIPAGGKDPGDPLHTASGLSDVNLRRIRASVPGGSWRDWPTPLRARCHVRASGKTYPSVYGRMEWQKPAPTITTQAYGFGNGRFGHPQQDRAISLREAAILQSFPPNFQFTDPCKPIKFAPVGRLIGNAVPVALAEAIGQSIALCAQEICGLGA